MVKIEKLAIEPEKKVKFDTLLIGDEKEVRVGAPSLGDLVEGKVIEHGKSKKITVVKYKSKTRYKKTTGHRQNFTKIQIEKIS